MDYYGFYTGKILNAYEYLGCHLYEDKAIFRTFAPAASRISVIGDFSDWNEIPMNRIYNGSFWELEVPNIGEDMKYKYRVYKHDGTFIDHADPYGFSMEKPPMSASVTRKLYNYVWRDQKWMQNRTDCKNAPLNIYELHLGSWRKKSDNTWYSYSEIASQLVDYVKEKGYNYIEVMPLAEHPCDNSWGYQQTGFYSPTARYGTPNELRYFIDYAHQNGIGVILDFVPVHFAVDGYALANYDGTPLYEYPSNDIGYSEWGSKNFNHSRGEVQSFLQSNAYYWLKEFHFDGLRIDALSNIIYWHGNKNRGVNTSAVEFIKHMNRSIKEMDSSIMLIAEDSTAFGNVTKPVSEGGLGFDYKWDMGWMNDTLAYFKTHPYDRKRDYHKLTFSMMYYYSENFLLPFSHDEVVHGKATILQKMYGDYDDKFPQARALYLYMYTHPGKKLNFMANEIGQLREWDENREQDWDILSYSKHDTFSRFTRDLCLIYQSSPALYELDHVQKGFEWIDCHQEEKCIYAYKRISSDEKMVILLNLSDEKQSYSFEAKDYSSLQLILSTDNVIYGGDTEYENNQIIESEDDSFTFEISPYSGMLFKVL